MSVHVMSTYRKIPQRVHVIRFDFDMNPHDVFKFAADHGAVGVGITQGMTDREPRVVIQQGWKHTGHEESLVREDYLVIDALTGHAWAMSRAEFQLTYEPESERQP